MCIWNSQEKKCKCPTYLWKQEAKTEAVTLNMLPRKSTKLTSYHTWTWRTYVKATALIHGWSKRAGAQDPAGCLNVTGAQHLTSSSTPRTLPGYKENSKNMKQGSGKKTFQNGHCSLVQRGKEHKQCHYLSLLVGSKENGIQSFQCN